ncbi:MAG TPA: serine hydrolase [Balneolaceae bacterium]|nr:serine hydrolase [Balneolaceae bacterium]
MKSYYAFLLCFLFFISCSSKPETVDELKKEVEKFIAGEPGYFAIEFRSVQEPDIQFSIHADTLFHAASTMKTPVMVEVYKQAMEGKFALSDSLEIKNLFTSIVDGSEFSIDIRPDSDDPIEKMIGEKETIYNLTHAMITYSSNIATNMIIELVGAENTTETMRELGARNIDVLRGVYDMKAFDRGLSNRTTARDLAVIFEHLANGTAVSPDADRNMIEILKDQFYQDIIPAKLPNDTEVANKTGSIDGVEHDSGLVFLPDGRSYLLIFLSKDLENDLRGREVGAEVSRMVYDYMTNVK